MSLRKLAAPLVLTTAVFVPSSAYAGGFYVPEIGPKASAMGGAAAGRELDTTNIFHNPAGLAGQPGHQIQVAGTAVLPNVEFFRRPTNDPMDSMDDVQDCRGGDLSACSVKFDPVRNTNRFGAIPFVGFSTDATVENLAVGVGVFVPFGAHIAYPEDGAQRHIVTDVNFKTIYVAPTIAYKFFDRLSVGAGLNYIYSDITIQQINAVQFVTGDPETVPDPDPAIEGTTDLAGRDPASFSANVGIMYTDVEGRFGIGASVMTPTTLRFNGEATIENEQITPYFEDGEEVFPGGSRSDDFSLDYPLPMIVRIGTMVRPIEQLTLALDVNWQRWKTFEKLVVDFENQYELLPTPGAFMADVEIENHWKNTLTARFGVDAMPVPDPKRIPLHLRAGLVLDQGAVPDEYFDVLAPDSDKLGISAGLGYSFKLGSDKVWMDIDISYMHLFFKERNIDWTKVGPDEFGGNDDDGSGSNDTTPNNFQEVVPGSKKTVVNKPAPSFFHGVTRASFDLLGLGIAVRFL